METNIKTLSKTGKMKVPAVVYASDKLFELMQQDKTLEQIKNVATLPGIVKHAIAMPDAHQGFGFPIGGVAAFDLNEGIVSPGGVGYDISCGMEYIKTDISVNELEKNKNKLLDALAKKIPAGVGSSCTVMEKDALEEVLFEGARYSAKQGFIDKKELKCFDDDGRVDVGEDHVSDKAKKRGKNQLGSLGAGNHFGEVQSVEKIFDQKTANLFGLTEGNIGMMIHCGSRGLGHQIATDYIEKMEKEFNYSSNDLIDKELIYAPLDSQIGQDYICAMHQATNYAYANRSFIYSHAKEAFEEVFDNTAEALGIRLIRDISHNIARIEKHKIDGKMKKVCIHRKGATYLRDDIPAIIPGSMGTASYLLSKGKNAEELSFSSTAHGAGRVMSRSKARKTLDEEKIRNGLIEKDISVHCISRGGFLEEAPPAYKDIDEVINVSCELGLTERLAKLKPILCLKG